MQQLQRLLPVYPFKIVAWTLLLFAGLGASPLYGREPKAVREANTKLLRHVFIDLEALAVCDIRTPAPTGELWEHFEKNVNLIAPRLKGRSRELLDKDFAVLMGLVKKGGKTGSPALCDAVSTLKATIIKTYRVIQVPSQTLSYEVGKEVFAKNCESCHGAEGRGNGPLAVNAKMPMIPEPTVFTGPGSHDYSVYHTLNVLLVGSDGRSVMGPFDDLLRDEELWSVAFYLTGLRHEAAWPQAEAKKAWEALTTAEKQTLTGAGFDLSVLNFLTDAELLSRLNKLPLLTVKPDKMLRLLRLAAPYDPKFPRKSP